MSKLSHNDGSATPQGEGETIKSRRDPGSLLPRDGDVELLARTLYGEARGEKVRGKEAVASVIMNRVKRAQERGGYWWGNDLGHVILKSWQFSCWNENDPNLEKLKNVTVENRVFQTCIRIARRAVVGAIDDPTHGATHYHTKGVHPPWARGKTPSAEIGKHLFYANIE